MDDRRALETAARLEVLGVEVRSAELREVPERHHRFAQHGNRAMRRARAKSNRKRGG